MNFAHKVFDRLRYLSLSRALNRGINAWESTWRRERLRSMPDFVIIEPSNICNLRCPLCPTGQRLDVARGVMSMEVFRAAVDQLHNYVRHMNLFYLGEPLLCQNLPEMINYARGKRIRVSVSSNLNVFDSELADRLIAAQLPYLIVSLDGASQETYGYYRVGGDFNRVLDNIRLLLERKRAKNSRYPRVLIQFVIFKHNETDVPGIKQLAQDLGVELFFRQGALGGQGQSPPLQIDREMAHKWLTAKKDYQLEYDYFGEKPYLRPGACGYLWKVATVNWDGSVLPCCWIYDNRHSFGNIMKEDFRAIWNGESFRSARWIFGRHHDTNGHILPRTICHQCRMYQHQHAD